MLIFHPTAQENQERFNKPLLGYSIILIEFCEAKSYYCKFKNFNVGLEVKKV